ncbi:MAG TPA: DNA repair exonuclease [Chromatiaceae bacterium]|nr:DNA repair exonuclease [Chromatiaceae bacterium]
MKFIHAADIHLDSPLRGLGQYEGAPIDEIRGATRRAFENLIQLAIDEQVAFVLLAGDLYDGDWKDYNTGLFFTRQMGLLQEAGISAYLVAGNHDAASQVSKSLRPPPNVHVFSTRAPETVRLEQLGVAVHGQGFATRAVTEDLSLRYPAADPDLFNIGLLHTSLDGRPGHEVYAPCTLDGLRSRGYQYWALGHVHKREVIAEQPWVVFPGNTQGRHARETGAKGCSLVSVEAGAVVAVEQRALDVVRWSLCAVDVTDATTLDEVYDRVGQALDGALADADGKLLAVRLQLRGACPVHIRLRAAREQVSNECRSLAGILGAGALWIEKVQLDTSQVGSEQAALARDDALGGLLRSIRDLELDSARLSKLVEEVADLNSKLPSDLRSGVDGFDPSRPELIRDCLEDVKALLLERLLHAGGTE